MEHSYETVSEALLDLSRKGYTTDFLINAQEEQLISHESIQSLSPNEFEIDEIFRFDGMTDPADAMIIFAISSIKNSIKGVILNGYGIYEDPSSSKIVERLRKHIDK